MLVEAWLGRDYINIDSYQLPNYFLHYTQLNKHQNDGILIFIDNSTSELQT